jgi:hypothetical protein
MDPRWLQAALRIKTVKLKQQTVEPRRLILQRLPKFQILNLLQRHQRTWHCIVHHANPINLGALHKLMPEAIPLSHPGPTTPPCFPQHILRPPATTVFQLSLAALRMDHVPQKRPQRDDAQSVASQSVVTLLERSRADESARPAVTATGGREVLATSAANDRNGASKTRDDDDDDDYTSSSGSSLSSSDEEDDDDNDTQGEIARESGLSGDSDQITSLPARKKPNIRRFNNSPSLLSKLSAFLPQMKTANEDLEKEIAAGRSKDIQLDAEDDEDDEHRNGQYIEMVRLGFFL